MYKVQQVRHRNPIVGVTIGQPATIVDGLSPGQKGYVLFRGELWQAVSDEALPRDAKAYISGVDGLVLHVSSHPPPAPKDDRSIKSRLTFLLRRKAAESFSRKRLRPQGGSPSRWNRTSPYA